MSWQIMINNDNQAIRQDELSASDVVQVEGGGSTLSQSFCESLMANHSLADIPALCAYLSVTDMITGAA